MFMNWNHLCILCQLKFNFYMRTLLNSLAHYTNTEDECHIPYTQNSTQY